MSGRGEPLGVEAPGRPAPDEVSEDRHPSLTPFLLGHQNAEKTLAAAIESGNLHHAWLIAGPVGIGKATLAYRLARRLLDTEAGGPNLFGDSPDGLETAADSPVFAQIASGSHPNLLKLVRRWDFKTKKYGSGIRVDEVRQLTAFLGQRADRAGRRVVIVDAADDMTGQAENALLKPLEEPPLDTVFVLISHQPGALLPTIRSRCRRLDLRPPSFEVAREVLQRLDPEQIVSGSDQALALSGNAPGMAMRLLQQDGIAVYADILNLLSHLPGPPQDLVQRLASGMERGVDAERRFHMFLDLLEGAIRRMMLAAVPDGPAQPEVLAAETEIAARLTGGGLDQWFDLCDNLRRLRDRTDAVNLNRKAVILTLVSALETAARRASA